MIFNVESVQHGNLPSVEINSLEELIEFVKEQAPHDVILGCTLGGNEELRYKTILIHDDYVE